jgi:hypothetical protein
MTTHECHPPRSCCCSIQALEPDEQCPIHGHPTRFPCVECGRFLGNPNRIGLMSLRELRELQAVNRWLDQSKW